MPLTPSRSGRFRKDYKLVTRRGKDMSKILRLMKMLADQESLEPRHRDHNLVGPYVGCRECHVEPDWLATAKEFIDPVPAPSVGLRGKWVQRVPKSLHAKLAAKAEKEGVSLNTLVVSLIAEGLGRWASGFMTGQARTHACPGQSTKKRTRRKSGHRA